MVAVIKTGSSIHRILNYNEQKTNEGVAMCIGAVNYLIPVEKLLLKHKLNRLLNQAALNENVTRNSVHISLNFDPSEKLSTSLLLEIADAYMQKIGFEEQPYLVYEHYDAGHPHIHIVSVKVRADGTRVDTQNIGRNQSEKARKEIEDKYGLVRADHHKQKQVYTLKPINVQKVQYGRSETRRAITNVLDAVLKNYKYTSLGELNAVLQQYNVAADRGTENSRVFLNKGLNYRIIDELGNKVGVPIKASDFYSKPTLKFLEQQFKSNEPARQPFKARVKNAIDLSLLKMPNQSLPNLIKALEKQGINTIVRQNNDGVIYGITYVDHQTKSVFNGSALGKQYSAKGMLERCGQCTQPATSKHEVEKRPAASTGQQQEFTRHSQSAEKETVLDILLQPQQDPNYTPNDLTGKKRKKRKKRSGNHL